MPITPPTFSDFDNAWFLTWTTYGTWLPGDKRGYVAAAFEDGVRTPANNTPGTPYDRDDKRLRDAARASMTGDPVWLTAPQARSLGQQFEETAQFRNWCLVAGAIMRNHVHLLVGVTRDPLASGLLRDFKSYGSRRLNRDFGKTSNGKWWTEHGSRRRVKDDRHFDAVTRYVFRQSGALLVFGRGADAPRSGEDDAERTEA